ncbi:hypothetical protein [Leuconostoc citreum]
MSASTRLSTNSGTINQVIDNDNYMPDYSQAKNTVNQLFEAGYTSNQRVLAQVANTKVQRTINYQLSGQMTAKGYQVTSLTLGNLTKGDQ